MEAKGPSLVGCACAGEARHALGSLGRSLGSKVQGWHVGLRRYTDWAAVAICATLEPAQCSAVPSIFCSAPPGALSILQFHRPLRQTPSLALNLEPFPPLTSSNPLETADPSSRGLHLVDLLFFLSVSCVIHNLAFVAQHTSPSSAATRQLERCSAAQSKKCKQRISSRLGLSLVARITSTTRNWRPLRHRRSPANPPPQSPTCDPTLLSPGEPVRSSLWPRSQVQVVNPR